MHVLKDKSKSIQKDMTEKKIEKQRKTLNAHLLSDKVCRQTFYD